MTNVTSNINMRRAIDCWKSQLCNLKLILNSITFAPWLEICKMHITLLRAFQWYQKSNEGPHGLGGLRCGHHKTKQTPILM